MSEPNFMQECYDKFVTPEYREKVEHMTNEECGILFINKNNMETRKFLVYCKLDGIRVTKEVILEKGEKANVNTFLEKVMPNHIFMEKEFFHNREVLSWSLIEE